jgi:hypothetical protein
MNLRLETFEEAVEKAVQRFKHSLSTPEKLETQASPTAKDGCKSSEEKGTSQNPKRALGL